jgi:AcrR family transcriptional regulator
VEEVVQRMPLQVGQRFVPPPAPKTPKAARTRRRLLDLAGQLFIERGYGAVSIRDIADAAGLTNGAVYGHFRSKGQLLVEVIRWNLAEQDHAPEFAEAVEDIDRGARLMFSARGRETRLLEVDAAAAARHDPDVAAGLAELYGERHARIADAFAGTRDAETSAFLVAAITGGIGMRESSGIRLPIDERLTTAIVGMLESLV